MFLIPGNLPSVASPVQYQYMEKVACLFDPVPERDSDKVSALPAESVVEVAPKQRMAQKIAKDLNLKLCGCAEWFIPLLLIDE